MSDRLGAASVANNVATKVGLFGWELTDFLASCVTLGDLCKSADYDPYSGWAVGVSWEHSSSVANDQVDGVVFKDSKWSVQTVWSGTAAANVVSSGIVTDISATAPTNAQKGTLAVATDPFKFWSAKPTTKTATQFAFAFFSSEETDTFYFEVDSTASVWATKGAVAGVSGNVETAAFVFKGAASLTAAAASVIVASLLF